MVRLRLRLLFGLALCLVGAVGRLVSADLLPKTERSVARSPVYFAPAAAPETQIDLSRPETLDGDAPLRLPAVEPDEASTFSEAEDKAVEAQPEAPCNENPPTESSSGIVDIRQPDPTADEAAEALKSSVEPSWLNDVIDENAALWRESTDVLEIIPNSSGFGLTSLGFTSMWKSENAPGVWVVPRFGWTFVSGPSTPAVQAQLYDLRLEMNIAQPLNDVWTVHLQLAPAFVTDWNNKSKDAFRLIGGGMLAAHVNDELTLIGGVLALSRFDLPVLPLGGVRWHPTPWLEVDALFPNPRLSWKYRVEEDKSHWLYIAGQLGGNQWAIDHATNDNDKLGYRDYRVVIGCETRQRDGNRSLFEVGYVFDRQLKFSHGVGNQQPGETFIIRWGSRF